MKYIIYMHTSPSGHSYVGYTKLPIECRWKNKINEVKNTNLPLANALRKYGRKDWKHEILFETYCKNTAHAKETEFIQKFGYYNIAKGGEGGDTGRNGEPEKIQKQIESIKQHWELLDDKEKQRRIDASVETRRQNGTLGNCNPKKGEEHGKWNGYWYIGNIPYTTSKEASLLTSLNESTIIDLCVHNVDNIRKRSSKLVPAGKTPRECGHYKG